MSISDAMNLVRSHIRNRCEDLSKWVYKLENVESEICCLSSVAHWLKLTATTTVETKTMYLSSNEA